MRSVLLIGSLVLAVVSCGGEDDGGGGGDAGSATSGRSSCEMNAGGVRSCSDQMSSGVELTAMQWSTLCTAAGGKKVASCSRQGVMAGCVLTTAMGATSITTMVWYYDLMPAAVKMICAQARGTYVAP